MLQKTAAQLRIYAERHGSLLLAAVLDASQAQVVGQNLFERKAALCGMAARLENLKIGVARGLMQVGDRFLQLG